MNKNTLDIPQKYAINSKEKNQKNKEKNHFKYIKKLCLKMSKIYIKYFV